MPRNDLIQVRRDTAANWTSANPTLASGEIGLETDTGRYKIGNGTTPWNSLQINLEVDNLTVGGDINVDNLVASGDIDLSGNVTANIVVALDSGVFVGPVSVGDTLEVGGVSSLNDDLYVNGLCYSDEVQAGNSIRLDNDYLTPYNGFRNAIINGDFRINQRAFTSITASDTYGFDRWAFQASGGTSTMTPQTFTVGSPAAIGYESANFCRLVTSGQTLTSHYSILYQKIEDVRTFANSTVTISFWAKAASGAPKIAIEFGQVFGTGGSPSAGVNTYAGQTSIGTSWARYSITATVPSTFGKTIGTTANTSLLAINFWVSAGANFNSRTGSIGLQNNTFDFWGVQVERGSVATPFEQRPIGTELALCQRYFQSCTWNGVAGADDDYSVNCFGGTFPVQMRISPNITVGGTTALGHHETQPSVEQISSQSVSFTWSGGAYRSIGFRVIQSFTASAEL